jgi:hypothetical protein
MQAITATNRVRLTEDLPELQLYRGEVGIVRGAWYYPNAAYEVEFPCSDPASRTCTLLLLDNQVAPEREPDQHACGGRRVRNCEN